MEIITVILLVINLVLLILLLTKKNGNGEVKDEIRNSRMETVQSVQNALNVSGTSQKEALEKEEKAIKELADRLTESQKQFADTVAKLNEAQNNNIKTMLENMSTKITEMRDEVDKHMTRIDENNRQKLDEMKQVVDEKLQKTLNDRISSSFKEVSERLEQVYKSMGEMQTLAVGVGDLKKVLSNVKTRGILGEIQLGSIIEQIMSPEQYEKNVVTVKGTSNPVEYAIKLPGEDKGEFVYLPIDAKFPADAYTTLLDAYESGDPEAVKSASATLSSRIKSFAKDIKTKYIYPPDTTEFGIMFLPTEGLYAEVVKMGLVETLQADYRITVAGPTTMAALLNSLQMGFRTIAIQKRSGDVWRVLSEVKTEFVKFEDTLSKAQKNLDSTYKSLEDLVGTRTRAINRKLKNVELITGDGVPLENEE